MRAISDLEPDDYDGAVGIYRRRVLDGTWRPEDASIMYRIIADPDKLRDRIARVNAEPAVAEALARLAPDV